MSMPMVHPPAQVIAQSAKLAQAFREKGLPVVLVNVAGVAPGRTETPPRAGGARPANWTELVPELDQQPGDILVTKYTWGAVHGTPLDMHLRRQGVTQVVLCGIATSIGVESTARSLYECGYNLTLVTDAMTDRDAETHENSIKRIFPRLGETGTTQDVLAKLG